MVSTENCSPYSKYETCDCYGYTSRTIKKTPNKFQEKVGTRLDSLPSRINYSDSFGPYHA